MSDLKRVICNRCESMTKPEKYTPGHFLIEVALWLCFLLPGVLYSLWRFTSKRNVCSTCGSDELIPFTSPKGKRLLAQQQTERLQTSTPERPASAGEPSTDKLEHQPA